MTWLEDAVGLLLDLWGYVAAGIVIAGWRLVRWLHRRERRREQERIRRHLEGK